MPPPSGCQRYGFLLLPGFETLALAGALDALAAANEVLEDDVYDSLLLSADGAAVASAGGLVAEARPLAGAPPLHAAFVVAAAAPWQAGPCDAARGRAIVGWLQHGAARGAALGGIGHGAAWLAHAGLLRGHRATVHWSQVPALAERHAETVVSQHVYEIDRARLSCAGAHASLDMTIAWLGLRHGERVGEQVAARFGLERVRGPAERQRVPSSARAGSGSAKLAEAVSLMEANLGEPLPTEDIARLAGVSRRQLERLFKQHLDALPSRWYLGLRLARARRLLQQTPQSILQVALSCGFSSGPHFSNAYRSHFGHTPRDERSQRAAAWRQRGPAVGPIAAAVPAPSMAAAAALAAASSVAAATAASAAGAAAAAAGAGLDAAALPEAAG